MQTWWYFRLSLQVLLDRLPIGKYALKNKAFKQQRSIGFNTTFSLDSLEDPSFFWVQIARFWRAWENQTQPRGGRVLPEPTAHRGVLGRQSVFLSSSYFRKKRHISSRYSSMSRLTLQNTGGGATSPWHNVPCRGWTQRVGISMSLLERRMWYSNFTLLSSTEGLQKFRTLIHSLLSSVSLKITLKSPGQIADS